MITHDVDEAVLLSDRIVMMTNGPAATIGEILESPLERPRKRLELVDDPDLHPLPRRSAGFLYEHATGLRRIRSSEGPSAPMPRKLTSVVIGNGMAAGRALEELFERAPGAYDVTIFGAEPRVNYNRIMLSPVLAGEKTFDDIVINDDAWYETHGITLHRGKQVVEIDRAAKRVTAADGTTAEYDRLLVATGSMPFIMPVPGATLPGVVTFRDLDDVNEMLEAAGQGGHAVVIGGGLLGLEAAAGLGRRAWRSPFSTSCRP